TRVSRSKSFSRTGCAPFGSLKGGVPSIAIGYRQTARKRNFWFVRLAPDVHSPSTPLPFGTTMTLITSLPVPASVIEPDAGVHCTDALAVRSVHATSEAAVAVVQHPVLHVAAPVVSVWVNAQGEATCNTGCC